MLRSLMLKESSVTKMSLHMKSYENLTTICTATSLRKLINDFVVFVASVLLVAGCWNDRVGDDLYRNAYNILLLLEFLCFYHVMSHEIIYFLYAQ